jgi:hypothetical protein
MIFAPIDPTLSRGYLKRRLFESCIVLGTVFLVLAVLFSWVLSAMFSGFSPLIFGNIVAGLIAYYAYLVWNKQPMRIRCEACGGKVLCKTPWICGECGHENWDVDQFPFIHQCANCHLPPKAYLCHHCDAPLFLSEDHDTTNPARRINAEGHQPKMRTESQQKIEQDFEEKKRNIESAKLALTEAQIKAQIKAVKKGGPEVSIESALDIQAESLKQFMEATTAISEAARRQKLLNAKECKKDPAERRRRDLLVDAWIRQQLAKMTEEPRSE